MIDAEPLFVNQQSLDYHLTWNSPCKDAGDSSTPNLPEEDIEGDPRVADGKVDMGADEFFRHLYQTGGTAPGGALSLHITGRPSETVFLALGSDVLARPHSTVYGDMYLALPLLWNRGIGTIPSTGVLHTAGTVPGTWSAGDEKPLQALIGPLGAPFGKLTNLLILSVD
jgi:hypothetical protein